MAITDTSLANWDDIVQEALHIETVTLLKDGLPYLPESTTGGVVWASELPGQDGTHRFSGQGLVTLEADLSDLDLDEGITPTAAALAGFDDNTFTTVQKGKVFAATDVLIQRTPTRAGVAKAMVRQIARHAAETYNGVAKAIWAAQPGIASVGGGVTAPISLVDVSLAATRLRTAGVLPIGGAQDEALGVTGGEYVAIVHPNVVYDLMEQSANGFIALAKYGPLGANAILRGEIGMYSGVRFVVSNGAIRNSATGEYKTIVYGQQALAFSDMNSLMTSYISEKPTKDDPLGQRAVGGWKAWVGGVLIDLNGGYRHLTIVTGSSVDEDFPTA